MFRHYIDTRIWFKKWFKGLTPEEKLAYLYINDHCDSDGIWEPDFALAEFKIGAKINWDEFVKKCNGHIIAMPNGTLKMKN